MGEFDSTTYSLSNDGRNASVVMFAMEKVPETKSPFESGLLAPPSASALGSRRRSRSLLPRAKEDLRFAGGAVRIRILPVKLT